MSNIRHTNLPSNYGEPGSDLPDQFRVLADTIAQMAWMAKPDGEIFWWNRRWYEFTGLTRDEMATIEWSVVHHPDYHQKVESKYFEQISRRKAWHDTFPLRRHDGEYRWFLTNSMPLLDKNGDVIIWFGTNTDITDQMATESKMATAYKYEAILNRISQVIRSTNDPEKIQLAAATELGEFLKVDRAYFSIVDIAHDKFWIGQDYRRPDLPSLSASYRLSDFPAPLSDLYPEGKTLVVTSMSSSDWDDEIVDQFRSSDIEAAIRVPIYQDGQMVASLGVGMAEQSRNWTNEEISLVEAIAVQIRSAVDIARIRKQEHRVAEELQNALQPELPSNLPGLSIGTYTRPALDEAAIGGDFLDVFTLDINRYAIVIGDVSGKGLAAAQQLALVRNSLRTTLYLCPELRKAVESLNRILSSYRLISGFVTVFVGIYDVLSGSVTYCSCGHEPALIRRAGTGKVEQLEISGPPLGILDDSEYPEQSVHLRTGDVLLLYTDGISESGRHRNEMLGTEGLATLFELHSEVIDVQIQAENLVETIRTSVDTVFLDDVAVLLARKH